MKAVTPATEIQVVVSALRPSKGPDSTTEDLVGHHDVKVGLVF